MKNVRPRLKTDVVPHKFVCQDRQSKVREQNGTRARHMEVTETCSNNIPFVAVFLVRTRAVYYFTTGTNGFADCR